MARIGHIAVAVASDSQHVLSGLKMRATLCLLRRHLRKSRNSERVIAVRSLYPSALAQRTQRLAELRRIEGRGIGVALAEGIAITWVYLKGSEALIRSRLRRCDGLT